jgi:hypothetical protein
MRCLVFVELDTIEVYVNCFEVKVVFADMETRSCNQAIGNDAGWQDDAASIRTTQRSLHSNNLT